MPDNDITGQKFNKLTAIQRADMDKNMDYKTAILFTPEEIEEKEEKRENVMKKIDDAIKKEMMNSGKMGTEAVTVRIQLSNAEKDEFLNFGKYDSENYSWEFEGNTLIISYTEEVEA